MAGFKGQADYSVDEKGRVAIPAKMRAQMSPEAEGKVTITRGFERCIFVYPQDRWREIEEDMEKLNPYSKEARKFMRIILMWAEEAVLDDRQGRIRLPDELREYAGIQERVLIIGALDHMEIWDPDVFAGYINEDIDAYETLAERVMQTS